MGHRFPGSSGFQIGITETSETSHGQNSRWAHSSPWQLGRWEEIVFHDHRNGFAIFFQTWKHGFRAVGQCCLRQKNIILEMDTFGYVKKLLTGLERLFPLKKTETTRLFAPRHLGSHRPGQRGHPGNVEEPMQLGESWEQETACF